MHLTLTLTEKLCFNLKYTELCTGNLKKSTRDYLITQLRKTMTQPTTQQVSVNWKNWIIQNCIFQSPVTWSAAFKIEILVYTSLRERE
jgi:hypothetical protein